MSIIGIVIFLIGLTVSVSLHELGHMLPAKKFGVKVPHYFIGFGPTIWSTTRNGTEYGIKAIPLGGYVSLAGMLAPAKPGTKIYKKDGSLTAAEEARRAANEQLAENEADRAFWKLSTPKKMIVMTGGVLANLGISLAAMLIVFAGIGTPVFTTQIDKITPCLDPQQSVCSVENASPAARSNLQAGDKILAWNGVQTSSWQSVQEKIVESKGEVNVTVMREGVKHNIVVTPEIAKLPVVEHGKLKVDSAGKPVLQERIYLGITPVVEPHKRSVSAAFINARDIGVGTAKIIALLPVHLWNTGKTLFSDAPRDSQGLVSIVGIASLAGSITSAPTPTYSFTDRLADLLLIMGALNMSLFIFNLLPLLPLDGGHFMGAFIEGIRKFKARIFNQPDPGAFDTARLLPLSQAVTIFFIIMTVLLVVVDVVNPVF